MNNYDQYNEAFVVDSQTGTRPLAKTFMAKVFTWMFAALAVSAIFSVLFAMNESLFSLLMTETGPTMFAYVVMFAPLAFVLLMSFGANRLSAPAMAAFFMLYAAVNGISFSYIFYVYSLGSILSCFIAASLMFGVMAVMGYTTKQDLTSFGRILTMGLIGIIIASLINMFMGSEMMDYIISIIGVAVFTGLTAYDVQKLKRIGMGVEQEGVPAVSVKKMAVMGALSLYLDFIMIFLYLLRLFGGRRD